MELNGNHYKVYLLDTNIISQTLKDKSDFGSNIINKVLTDGIFCFSPYTIWELKAVENLYQEFKEIFFSVPSLLIYDYPEIVKLERVNYNKKRIEINDIQVFINKAHFSKGEIDLDALFDKFVTEDKLNEFRDVQDEVYSQFSKQEFTGIMAKGNSPSIKDIENSVLLSAFNLISSQELTFTKKFRKGKKVLDVLQFPSIIAMAYLYHYKFGTLRRKGEPSDISDILISSALPYVDCFITENSVANHLKQIGAKHEFLKGLEVMTMKDFK